MNKEPNDYFSILEDTLQSGSDSDVTKKIRQLDYDIQDGLIPVCSLSQDTLMFITQRSFNNNPWKTKEQKKLGNSFLSLLMTLEIEGKNNLYVGVVARHMAYSICGRSPNRKPGSTYIMRETSAPKKQIWQHMKTHVSFFYS